MSPKIRWSGLGAAVALGVFTAVSLLGGSRVEAQLKDLGVTTDPAEITVESPGFLDFCVGKKCQGQTCDEVNEKCVGSVTLQPALGEPLVGLKQKELDRFRLGAVLFDKTFVEETGLGPVFNQDSCASCHSTPIGGSGTITVLRFGKIEVVGTDLVFDPLTQFGGSLWNSQSISAACVEEIPVPPTNYAANRLTNSTLGFGLVEAIRDLDIEINALAPPPGVSGRVHIVPVLEKPGQTAVGRFGWKDQLATVRSFTADAMVQEMGITNKILPEDNAPNNDPLKLAACDTVADPEDVPDADGNLFVDLTTDFQRFLAAPPQTPRSGMTGEAIFEAIGCANCHMGGFVALGDDETEDAIQGKTVNAYSDFLLHDMGGNGDFIGQGGAGLTEIRTTLLWGLRIRDPLWHDGRVAGGTFDFRIFNAVMQHDADGSEAQASAQAFFSLQPFEREVVVSFLDSLGRREFDMDGDGDVDEGDALLVEDCAMLVSPISPDDNCAIADVDQDGDVDDHDLDLLKVALGIADDEGDDESDDGSSDDNSSAIPDDEEGDDHFTRFDLKPPSRRGPGALKELDSEEKGSSNTPTGSAGSTDPEKANPDEARARLERRAAGRRGQ